MTKEVLPTPTDLLEKGTVSGCELVEGRVI